MLLQPAHNLKKASSCLYIFQIVYLICENVDVPLICRMNFPISVISSSVARSKRGSLRLEQMGGSC